MAGKGFLEEMMLEPSPKEGSQVRRGTRTFEAEKTSLPVKPEAGGCVGWSGAERGLG